MPSNSKVLEKLCKSMRDIDGLGEVRQKMKEKDIEFDQLKVELVKLKEEMVELRKMKEEKKIIEESVPTVKEKLPTLDLVPEPSTPQKDDNNIPINFQQFRLYQHCVISRQISTISQPSRRTERMDWLR